MRSRALAVATLAMLCLYTSAVFGQSSDGNITGTVVDATGAAATNASVQLESAATGVKSATKTDGNDIYRFNNVLIGRYSVSVAATGFSSLTLRDVLVELN